jgi:hypothetical protein
MCRLRLNFEHGTAQEFMDVITNTATINLYLRNIHTTQSNCNTIEFESSKDRTYAMLMLSDPLYTLTPLD